MCLRIEEAKSLGVMRPHQGSETGRLDTKQSQLVGLWSDTEINMFFSRGKKAEVLDLIVKL